MAFRINTVEYAWETNTVAQSGSLLYLTPTMSIYIPETGSRTFLSVGVELYLRDANQGSTISNITTWTMNCKIDNNTTSAAAGTVKNTVATIAMTGDHTTLFFKENFTDAFNRYVSGSQHQIQMQWVFPQANAGVWNGHGFKLIATYQFNDDNATTRIKTVRLPLDSLGANGNLLGTTQQAFGNNHTTASNIPALHTFLPESSKVFRQIFAEYIGTETGAITAVSLVTQLDSGSESTRYLRECILSTDTLYVDYQDFTSTLDTGSVHQLKRRATISNRFSNIGAILYVTYEYNIDTTNVVMNSIELPLNSEFYKVGNLFPNFLRGYCSFLIPESNPSLVQSAIIAKLSTNGSIGTSRRFQVQNWTNSISSTRGAPQHSPINVIFRIDNGALESQTGGQKLPNITLYKGYNRINVDSYGGDTFANGSITAYILLNYSASKLSNGVDASNKTVEFMYGTSSGFTGASPTGLFKIDMFPTQSINPEVTSSYYINGIITHFQANHATANPFDAMFVDITSSNYPTSCSVIAHGNFSMPYTEQGAKNYFTAHDIAFKYPNSPIKNDKILVNYFWPGNTYASAIGASPRPWIKTDRVTINYNIFRITGSLLNCSSSNENYNLNVIASASNFGENVIYNIQSSGSGTTKYFMFDWYEDISKLYVVSSYPEYGISNSATASHGNIFTINFSTGSVSSGGEKSFTFIG